MSSAQTKPRLRLDWCSRRAARFACERWHYSRKLTVGGLVTIGVWEDDSFIGTIVYSKGSGRTTDARQFGLARTNDAAELCRIALKDHRTPVSKMIAISTRMIRRQSPGLRMLISYADPMHGHSGAIYQAANWLYVGDTAPAKLYRDKRGKVHHSRVVSPTGYVSFFGKMKRAVDQNDCEVIDAPGKHKYLYPLDEEAREVLKEFAKPYPKRPKDSSEPSGHRPEEGGAAPTRTLQPC